MKNPNRTTLLINLSVEEAEEIRAAAKKQDRTISVYVLRAVRRSLQLERQIEAQGYFLDQHRHKR
jgi:hypothetical protein